MSTIASRHKALRAYLRIMGSLVILEVTTELQVYDVSFRFFIQVDNVNFFPTTFKQSQLMHEVKRIAAHLIRSSLEYCNGGSAAKALCLLAQISSVSCFP
jgi:hypothetical protein